MIDHDAFPRIAITANNCAISTAVLHIVEVDAIPINEPDAPPTARNAHFASRLIFKANICRQQWNAKRRPNSAEEFSSFHTIPVLGIGNGLSFTSLVMSLALFAASLTMSAAWLCSSWSGPWGSFVLTGIDRL